MRPGEPGYVSQLSSLFFVIVVMFLVDALAPMGLVAAGGGMQTVGAFFLFMGLRKKLSLLGQQRSLLLGVFLDISSAGQNILYLEKG